MTNQLEKENLFNQLEVLPDNINIGSLCSCVMQAMNINVSCTKPADIISILAIEIDRQKNSIPYDEFLYECVNLTALWYTHIMLVKIKAKEEDLAEMRTKVSNAWKKVESII